MDTYSTSKLINAGNNTINSTLDFTTGGPVMVDGRPGSFFMTVRSNRCSRAATRSGTWKSIG